MHGCIVKHSPAGPSAFLAARTALGMTTQDPHVPLTPAQWSSIGWQNHAHSFLLPPPPCCHRAKPGPEPAAKKFVVTSMRAGAGSPGAAICTAAARASARTRHDPAPRDLLLKGWSCSPVAAALPGAVRVGFTHMLQLAASASERTELLMRHLTLHLADFAAYFSDSNYL